MKILRIPPSTSKIKECFQRDQKEILFLTDYLVNAGYKDIGIDHEITTDGQTALVDMEHVPFMTKLEPLSESGWYYYVADYEQWRVENQTLVGRAA